MTEGASDRVPPKRLRPMGLMLEAYDEFTLEPHHVYAASNIANGPKIWGIVNALGGALIPYSEAEQAIVASGVSATIDRGYLLALRERFQIKFPGQPLPSTEAIPPHACLGIVEQEVAMPASFI